MKPKKNGEWKDFIENLRELNKKLGQSVSFRRNFLMSIINGIGYVIGATIIAGILIAVLVKTAKHLPILERVPLQKYESQQK